jgi:hypothetical protein
VKTRSEILLAPAKLAGLEMVKDVTILMSVQVIMVDVINCVKT